ncbi:phosphoserine phosphatase [Peptococcaceae bacterium CEB3]|nr:phosphoserine phosphatase [Peptococcaceae bacterium CEB3]
MKVLETSEHVQERADYLQQFGNRQTVAIGNGANDELMLKQANLGIAVIATSQGEHCG